jgi:lactate permease
MQTFSVLLALFPIVAIFLLLVVRRTAADIAGLIGWGITLLVAWLYFRTPLIICLQISLGGLMASLPIALMVATSILQVTIMQETGAIARVVETVKRISPEDPVVQIMIINMGVGTLLAALGATPVSILPPIMLALGFSSFAAIALPAIGYDALCTYSLMGIPVVVFSNFTGLPVNEVGGTFARFMPVVSTCIAFGMLWIAGGWKLMLKGAIPTAISGVTMGLIAILMNHLGLVTVTGIAAGLGVVLVMMAYLVVVRKPVFTKVAKRKPSGTGNMALWAATSPWLILTFFALLINVPFLPFFKLTFTTLAMPVEIIPGAPEKVRLLWQAYFWVLISTLIALPFLKPSKDQLTTTFQKWFKRFPRPMLAAAIFFAIAFLYNHSGKGLDWQPISPELNMIHVLATTAANGFGHFYPLVSPFLGLVGGFISGSETSAIAMFTGLNLSIAKAINAAGLVVAAVAGIGGGIASVISPAKLQNAAASIDKIGEESTVLRTTFVVSLIITLIAAGLAFLWAY